MTTFEHTKARLSDLRTQLEVCKVHRIIPAPSSMESAVSIAESLVAAVERVRALHTPTCEHSGANCKSQICPMLVCQSCGDNYPCDTRKALETP